MKPTKSNLKGHINSRFSDGIRLVQGIFQAEAFDMAKGGERIYHFRNFNKIVSGSTSLLLYLMAARTQSWTPGGDQFGISQFTLFSIDETVVAPDCQAQMLTGIFSPHYDNLDPVTLDQINLTEFPCLRTDSFIHATSVPVNDCTSLAIPGVDQATMSSDVYSDRLEVCVKIGQGHVPGGQIRYYGLASLCGNSPDPTDLDSAGAKTDYVYAIEQFPVMVKRSTITFSFVWSLYFSI
jgi:hypothetical protein